MSTQPLTHHEILALVEPFTRLGWRLDLPGSDRLARRLVFSGPASGAAALISSERLWLENSESGWFRLTRVLVHRAGLEATLEVSGTHPGELLTRSESVDRTSQFICDDGIVTAHSYRLEGDAGERRVLTRADTRVAGVAVTLRAPLASGAPAEIELKTAPGDNLVLPEDLLAVLGLGWALLTPIPQGWRSAVSLRGSEPKRSQRAERAFHTLTRHLAETLRDTPAGFQSQRTLARWAVAVRRASPVLVSAALIAGVAALPRLHIAETSAIRMLLFNLPPVLLVLVFCMREIPPFELPARPPPLRRAHWRDPLPLRDPAPLGDPAPRRDPE